MRYDYANKENQPVGPFALADLEKILLPDVISPATEVCPEGGLEWVP